MNVAEYLRAQQMSILALTNETGIAYSTLQPHVSNGKELSLRTARKLAAYSKKVAALPDR